MSILEAEVPGKLLLFGEHVVLSGAPGIAVTLPITLQARLDTGYKGFTITGNSEHADTVANIARVVWERLDTPQKPEGQLSILSNIPIGQGFGSSAALCSALALLAVTQVSQTHRISSLDSNVIDATQLTSYERTQVWWLAHEGEKQLHGTPSGIDTGAVLHRGLNAFSGFETFPPGVCPCKPLGAWLVWGFIPRTQPAKTSIEKVAHARSTRAYQSLADIAKQSFSIITDPTRNDATLSALGKLADNAMHCFDALGIGLPAMKTLKSIAKTEGTAGGKLCGAGAGGAFWFLLKTKSQAQNLQHAFMQTGICNFAALAPI